MRILFALMMALASAGAFAAPKYLILNEDNDHFFKYPASYMDEEHLKAYVDQIAEGGKVTHIHFCPTGGRASFDSKTWEPIWKGLEEYPEDKIWFLFRNWSKNAKALHDKGIDPYKVWIARCREKGISPWLAPRMNDMHDAAANLKRPYRSTTFWRTHRNLRLYPDYEKESWSHHQLNYAHQEVRDDAYAMIEELFERYDMDGLSICGNIWFPKETARESTPILSDFMRRIRRLADEWEKKRGHPIGLCAQIGGGPDDCRRNGYDVGALAKEGVFDWVICDTWRNGLNVPVEKWRAEFGGRDVKLIAGAHESSSCSGEAPYFAWEAGMFRGWADVLATAGVDGYHFWNLQYHPQEQFGVCHYGLDPRDTKDTERSYMTVLNGKLPFKLDKRRTLETKVGANTNGLVHVVLGFADRAPNTLDATLNGVKCVWEREAWVQKYLFIENHEGHEFEPRLGLQGRTLVFPAGTVKTGMNRLELGPTAGGEELVYFELKLVPDSTAPKAKIEREPHPDDNAYRWQPLFDKTLSNAEFKPGAWHYDAEGLLTPLLDEPIWSKAEYENYVLDLEYKMQEGGNSGVFIYISHLSEFPKYKIEVQLLDDYCAKHQGEEPYQYSGSLYGRAAARVINSKPVGEWNRMTIYCRGKNVHVVLNGIVVVDANLDDWTDPLVNPDGTQVPGWHRGFPALSTIPTKGRVGFQGKHEDTGLSARYVRIAPLY